MTEHSYQDAVQVLRERLGGRWEGARDEGRDEIARVLRDALGYDEAAADAAIDAMVRTGQLRYLELSEAPRRTDETGSMEMGPVVTGPNVTAGAGGLPAVPTASGEPPGPGYWEIGRADGGEISSRSGQVVPS